MPNLNTKMFSILLPADIYAELLDIAQLTNDDAKSIACDAIVQHIKKLKRERTRADIAAYAAEMAGTDQDLEPDWEEAGLEVWRRTD